MTTFLSTLRGDGDITGDCYCGARAEIQVIKGENQFIFVPLNTGDTHRCWLCDREEHPKPVLGHPEAMAGHSLEVITR